MKKKVVHFSKKERDKIWCYLVSTSLFSLFYNKTYDTLRDTKSYEVVDGKLLIPYSDGLGEYKVSLKGVNNWLKHQEPFDAIVSLS